VAVVDGHDHDPYGGAMEETTTDGRVARTHRTRAAIFDALLGLLREGNLNPSAPQIAERAGISKRSLYVHFDTLEDLYRDVAERSAALVINLLWVIDPALPLTERIDAICDQRSKVHEEIGPLRRAATVRASTSPAAAASRRYASESSRQQVERVFAPELKRLRPAARSRRVAAIDASLSGETWDLWRTTHGFSVGQSRRTMHEAVSRTLEI
jgi:AcrR family transcriptional regulator